MLTKLVGFFATAVFAVSAPVSTLPDEITPPLFIQSNAYVVARAEPLNTFTPRPKFFEPPKYTYCSCVEFAKWLTGHQGVSYGNAGDIKPNLAAPEVGAWILTDEGPGHAATIIEISDEGKLKTDEANWWDGKEILKPCQRTSRVLSPDNPKIRGYFKP